MQTYFLIRWCQMIVEHSLIFNSTKLNQQSLFINANIFVFEIIQLKNQVIEPFTSYCLFLPQWLYCGRVDLYITTLCAVTESQ